MNLNRPVDGARSLAINNYNLPRKFDIFYAERLRCLLKTESFNHFNSMQLCGVCSNIFWYSSSIWHALPNDIKYCVPFSAENVEYVSLEVGLQLSIGFHYIVFSILHVQIRTCQIAGVSFLNSDAFSSTTRGISPI